MTVTGVIFDARSSAALHLTPHSRLFMKSLVDTKPILPAGHKS